jgi:hypothetical protein
MCKLRQRGRDFGGRAGSRGIDPSLQPLPIAAIAGATLFGRAASRTTRNLKPNSGPVYSACNIGVALFAGLSIASAHFSPQVHGGRTFGPTEAALFRFMRCAQSSLDCVCGVENRVLLRRRHASFGLTIVQMHGPSPPRWAGCLDDVILDTLVFHAGDNGPREQRFLSGFGLTIQD